MRFEWDEEKAASNLRKHGVSFETAKLVFLDRLARIVPDDGEFGEERWVIIGDVDGVILKVVFTEREFEGETHVRIITARRVTRHERLELERR